MPQVLNRHDICTEYRPHQLIKRWILSIGRQGLRLPNIKTPPTFYKIVKKSLTRGCLVVFADNLFLISQKLFFIENSNIFLSVIEILLWFFFNQTKFFSRQTYCIKDPTLLKVSIFITYNSENNVDFNIISNLNWSTFMNYFIIEQTYVSQILNRQNIDFKMASSD